MSTSVPTSLTMVFNSVGLPVEAIGLIYGYYTHKSGPLYLISILLPYLPRTPASPSVIRTGLLQAAGSVTAS